MKSLAVGTITGCNKLFAAKTPYPLISLIRLDRAAEVPEAIRFGFYTVWLKGWSASCCPRRFGQESYDFHEAMLLPLPPGKKADCELWCCDESGYREGVLLGIHTSVMESIRAQRDPGAYSFFAYRENEALHLSQREKGVLETEMEGIGKELGWGIDEYSHTILCDRILLLLDYVARFYRRQFITRHEANRSRIERLDRWLDDFFDSGQARHRELPTAETLARTEDCSPAYLDDLLRHETGKNTSGYVRLKQIARAEKWLKQGGRTVNEVASELGFPSGAAFCALFQQLQDERRGRSRCKCCHPAESTRTMRLGTAVPSDAATSGTTEPAQISETAGCRTQRLARHP